MMAPQFCSEITVFLIVQNYNLSRSTVQVLKACTISYKTLCTKYLIWWQKACSFLKTKPNHKNSKWRFFRHLHTYCRFPCPWILSADVQALEYLVQMFRPLNTKCRCSGPWILSAYFRPLNNKCRFPCPWILSADFHALEYLVQMFRPLNS